MTWLFQDQNVKQWIIYTIISFNNSRMQKHEHANKYVLYIAMYLLLNLIINYAVSLSFFF